MVENNIRIIINHFKSLNYKKPKNIFNIIFLIQTRKTIKFIIFNKKIN